MRGSYEVKIWNNRVQYRFTIKRNLTILRGNSATGKSTLIGLIAQFSRNGIKSGVQLSCRCDCLVLTSESWQDQIRRAQGSLIFIDEDNDFIRSEKFAAAAKESDCYFIIVSRATLPSLPYSVEEIYELRNVTRGYGKVSRLYTEFQRIYSDHNVRVPDDDVSKPDCVVVEDSNSGYQFFQFIFQKMGIICLAANGNGGIADVISSRPRHSTILVIADGAAFGPYIERTLALRRMWNIVLFLPESFEWLILSSGLIDGKSTQEMLEDPSSSVNGRWHNQLEED